MYSSRISFSFAFGLNRDSAMVFFSLSVSSNNVIGISFVKLYWINRNTRIFSNDFRDSVALSYIPLWPGKRAYCSLTTLITLIYCYEIEFVLASILSWIGQVSRMGNFGWFNQFRWELFTMLPSAMSHKWWYLLNERGLFFLNTVHYLWWRGRVFWSTTFLRRSLLY